MLNLYKINNEKFKSIYFSLNFTMPVNEKENSENPVLASYLSKSNSKYNTQKDIEKFLYNEYGAKFDTIVEKFGDLYNIEFRIECINKKFLPNNLDVVNNCLKFIYTMIFEPLLVDNNFDINTVEIEKKFIINRIKERKDEKLQYAVTKMEELMCNGEPFGMYLYGKEDIVSKITPGDLYNRYLSMINNSCKTLIISGNLEGYDDIDNTITEIFNDKLDSKVDYSMLVYNTHKENENIKIEETTEVQDTNQSVVTFGFRVNTKDMDKDFYTLNMYNAILGNIPSSKLFLNVREKNSLAYTVRSRYYRYKSIIIIYAGIEEKNYNKAKEVVLEQINEMELGNITEEEFNAARESLISDLMEWYDSKVSLAKMLLSNLIVNQMKKVDILNMIDNIKKVTLEDVIEISKRIELEQIFLLGGKSDV